MYTGARGKAVNILRCLFVIATFSSSVCFNTYAEPTNSDKITICHRTHSETNPYNKITVSSSAWGAQNAHSGHQTPDGKGDIILIGDVPCPSDIIDSGPDSDMDSDLYTEDLRPTGDPVTSKTTTAKDEAVPDEVITALTKLVLIEKNVKDMDVIANFTSLKRIIDRLDARNSSFE